MMGYGLWTEFAKLPHVTLEYRDVYTDKRPVPQADFALIHGCFDEPIYSRLDELRVQTRHKIAGFMEIAFPSPLIDRAFTYLPHSELQKVEQIQLPILMSILKASNSPAKYVGSILLDHGWIENGRRTDWADRMYEWIDELRDKTVAQLRRSRGCEEPPAWVESIPEMSYPQYLARTATFETFVVTHPGSYEHSILDMAARGIRVLVPRHDGRPFCNPSIVSDLKLSTFSNRNEFVALLENLPQPSPVDQFTDIENAVGRIDAYFQENLP